ncbi:uncharacterized protein LOC133195741 [Saccostrea echinata]|uniref:uncharacterized protein LOC133195741 n=1 Tax=Saccostrea echinata TaxID=191078 RepID=UPI002A7FB1EB|nr:uncharacterized protein LOC133195741 [Saccostrea echinata]
MNPLQEGSFDSGFFSPSHIQIKVEPMSPTHLPMLNSDLNVSPLKTDVSGMDVERPLDDVSISGDWEKDFFSNFEDNLFNFDFDDKALNDILVSPKGKEALNDLMKSPKGKAIMNSPKGKMLQNRLKLYDTPENVKLKRTNSSGFDTSPNVLSPCDPNKMSATPGPYCLDSRSALKMSRRKLTMVLSGKEDREPVKKVSVQPCKTQPTKLIPIAPKLSEENCEMWPTKEKLKYARDQFKRTLELAVEASRLQRQVKQEPVVPRSPPRKRKRGSQKAEKYPELKQALNQRPQKSSSRNRMPSIKLRESKETEIEIKKELSAPALPFYPDFEEDIDYNDDDDEDYDNFYGNYVPFTGLKQAKKRKKFKQSVY